MKRINKKKYDTFDKILFAILTLMVLAMVFPFYNVVIMSFATPKAVAEQAVYLIPRTLDFSSYKMIFSATMIAPSLGVSLFVTVAGTALNMILTISAGYALSKKTLPGRKFIMGAILFTMLFNGGLIPLYLTIKSLGLINNILVMILPVALDTFYLIVMINYFRSVPQSLEESARLDGAHDIRILISIIIPISMPTIAAISLFYAVFRWNEWWNAMIFISDINKQPLQLILRRMLMEMEQVVNSTTAAALAQNYRDAFPTAMKMAGVVIAAVPILMVYPFLQKYFTQGIMIGSVKG